MVEAYVKPVSEVVREFGRGCIKHPPEIRTSSWRRFTVAIIKSGQERAYGDTVYMADVCFEGGGNTTKAGIDSPFFTKPAEKYVRALARLLTGAKEEPTSAFDTQITQCECIETAETYSIWRIAAVTPYTD